MKLVLVVFGILVLTSVVGIKFALAVAFLGSATALALWINRNVKVPSKIRVSRSRTRIEDEILFPSHEEIAVRETIY